MGEENPDLLKKQSILTGGALPIIVEADEISRLEGKDLQDLEKAFSLFDIDGSGDISIPELTAVLQSLGKDFSDEDLKEMHDIADKNGDGKIEFDDFHALMRETILRGIQENDLRDAFEVFDSDKDGFVTAKELQELFKNLGESIEIEDAVDMLNNADSDQDGLIDFKDFKAYYEKESGKINSNQDE